MNSCLYTGWIRHRRHHPRVHDFRYRLVLAYLDLDELDLLDRTVRPFSLNRWNLWSFFDRDHVDGRPGSTARKVRRLLAHHGIAFDGGTIRLLTQCRVLGYVFNPISLYYCRDADGALAAVVAEVSNTFGERHLYLLDGRQRAAAGANARFRAAKAMHVSPFLAMDCTYDFTLAPVGERLGVGIVQHEEGRHVLDAQLRGRRTPLTTRTLTGALLRYPFVTVQTIAAIHAEAARLYLKGIPFRRHPGETEARRSQRALLSSIADTGAREHEAVAPTRGSIRPTDFCPGARGAARARDW